MDKNLLIDFNSPIINTTSCFKIASPLIPLPINNQNKYAPRISDIDNNPFDKALRDIRNKDDPFECACEIGYTNEKEYSNEDKENISHAVSPYCTPTLTKHLKFSTTPLHIERNGTEQSPLRRKDLARLTSKISRTNIDIDIQLNNTSLEFLSESVFNESLNIAFSASTLSLSNDSKIENSNCSETKNKSVNKNGNIFDIPCIRINNENSSEHCSINYNTELNTITKNTSSAYSENNASSFNSESLGGSEISNIPTSAPYSNETNSGNIFDRAFFCDTIERSGKNCNCTQRKCMSARKSATTDFYEKHSWNQCLNNSFSGFHLKDRNILADNGYINGENCNNDSMFLEATDKLLAALQAEITLDANRPPWLEENIDLNDVEEEPELQKITKTKSIEPNNQVDVIIKTIHLDSHQCIEAEDIKIENPDKQTHIEIKTDEEIKENVIDIKTNGQDTNIIYHDEIKEHLQASNQFSSDKSIEVVQKTQKTKDLLQNLTDILQCDGKKVDKRKLGENLLNSIALALDLEQSVTFMDKHDIKNKTVNNEADSTSSGYPEKIAIKSKNRLSCMKKIESKIKTQLERNLKVKSDKEKSGAKGPLKAVIPLKNMAKIKKSINPKISFGFITPTKETNSSAFQIKRTSTPNGPKLKSPVAQSTPNITKEITVGNGTTPNRSFLWQRSPLTRPSNTSNLNKSVSPIVSSRAEPNTSHEKQNNRSIPTFSGRSFMYRRKSSSDLKSNDENVLQKSLDTGKNISKLTQLKRSSSFQNKISYKK